MVWVGAAAHAPLWLVLAARDTSMVRPCLEETLVVPTTTPAMQLPKLGSRRDQAEGQAPGGDSPKCLRWQGLVLPCQRTNTPRVRVVILHGRQDGATRATAPIRIWLGGRSPPTRELPSHPRLELEVGLGQRDLITEPSQAPSSLNSRGLQRMPNHAARHSLGQMPGSRASRHCAWGRETTSSRRPVNAPCRTSQPPLSRRPSLAALG